MVIYIYIYIIILGCPVDPCKKLVGEGGASDCSHSCSGKTEEHKLLAWYYWLLIVIAGLGLLTLIFWCCLKQCGREEEGKHYKNAAYGGGYDDN